MVEYRFHWLGARRIAWPPDPSFLILRFPPCSGRPPAGVLALCGALCFRYRLGGRGEQCADASRRDAAAVPRALSTDDCPGLLAWIRL